MFVKNHFRVGFFTKLRCNFFGGFLADQYVLYDLKHNSKRDFLSEFDWYKSRYINEPFDFAFNNKVVCAEMLKQYIRVAEHYYIKNKGIIYDFEEGNKKIDDIISLLKQKKALIIKPFAMGKGQGVHLLQYKKVAYYIDNKCVSEDEIYNFLTSRNDYVVCEYINQHQYANDIFSLTANTIRLITMRDIDTNKNKIYFAVQRIGTSATVPVDNGSKGGLVSKIDIENGRLSEARSLHNLNIYYEHPDTGKSIEGVVIPMWDKIKEEILEVADRFPYMDFIAWDILLTDDGPCIIEANNSSGVNIIQLWGGQRNEELGKFYKHHNAIK